MNQNQKRIAIIEGDAFDADAIVAIVKYVRKPSYGVWLNGQEDAPFEYEFANAPDRNHAMAVVVDAWRKAVGDLTVVDAIPPVPSDPLPDQPGPIPEILEPTYWADEKGRFYMAYGGKPIYVDGNGQYIWNEGPPRRKNPLGPEARPILKIYVGEDGKPINPQPV